MATSEDLAVKQLEMMELPPLSPTTESAFFEALAELSEMERVDEVAVIKLETPGTQHNWLKDVKDPMAMSLRMATPPPSVLGNQEQVGGMSPSDKEFENTPEAKRARRSAIEKKSRHRRQQLMQRMRNEVKQLEAVHAEMVTRKQARSYRPFAVMSMDELEKKYAELSLVAHAMAEDQSALRELLQTHECFQRTVQSLRDERGAEHGVWNSGIPPSASYSVPFRQYSLDECYTIVRETYLEVERFCEADNFETTGATFMGWTDKRKVDRELQAMQFCFTKRFPLESAEHLMMQTWNIFLDGPQMAAMCFDSTVSTRFEVLQELNDNLVIIRRDHNIPSMGMTFGSVQMIFRLRTPTGYTMCSCTIPAPEIQSAMEPHEYFFDAFHCVRSHSTLMSSVRTTMALPQAWAGQLDVETNENQATILKVEMPTLKSTHYATLADFGMESPPASAVGWESNNRGEYGGTSGSFSPNDKEPVSFQDIVEAKRARRSAIEKKSRQRRQEMLKRMKAELTHLEAVRADMIKHKEAGYTVGLDQWRFLRLDVAPAMNGLVQKYSKLTLVKNALEEDQAALQKLLGERNAFYETVQNLTDNSQAVDKSSIWSSGVPPSSSFAAKFRPFTMEEISAFVRDTYEDIQRFTTSDTFETTGAKFMGWTDKRKLDKASQALQYGFTKHFPNEEPRTVSMKSWNVMTDGRQFERMAFNGSVKSRFEVLQVLDDDIVIIRLDHRIPNFPVTFVSIQVLARLRTPTGYTMCVRTISSPEITSALEPHENLTSVFVWNQFNQLYDEFDKPAGCEVVAAGSIMSKSRMKSSYWLFELACSVLRYENACIAPLLLKQN